MDDMRNSLGEPLMPPRIPRELHVLPSEDHIAHELEDTCPCGPRVEVDSGGMIVVHHSLDGRELAE